MGDLIELRRGVLPWAPPAGENLEILSKYGIPLAGLIQQFGQMYYFLCIEGEADPANVWAYLPIEGQEVEIARSTTPDELFSKLISDGRPFEVALHVDGQGLIRWGRVDESSSPGNALDAAFAVLHIADDELDRLASA